MLLVFTMRAKRYKGIDRITADNLFERLQTLTPDRLVIIADVRSHGYYDPGMQRIKNSIRVEPHRLKEELVALREFNGAGECEVYLYCSCPSGYDQRSGGTYADAGELPYAGDYRWHEGPG